MELALQFCVLVFLGIFGGHWIDQHYGTSPWGIVCGSLIGISTAFFLVVKFVVMEQKKIQHTPPTITKRSTTPQTKYRSEDEDTPSLTSLLRIEDLDDDDP